jgi:cytochrome c oxidase assembly protein subunit 15
MQPAPDNLPAEHRWLRRFTYLVIIATFSLIAIGGHVTSNDVGLAVPDGFTTFGHNTLLAPLSVWWNDFGTRWEHGHRLKGNVVGMLTIAMAVWLLLVYRDRSRDRAGQSLLAKLYAGIHCLRLTLEGPRPYLRLSGVVMLVAVISQGIMGALRVSEISLTLAFVHGICGQLILCGWVVIAAALSRPWLSRLKAAAMGQRDNAMVSLRWAVRVLLVLLLVQLTLGSAVRHFKADKAIPDFPLVYDRFLPPMSQSSLDEAYVAYYAGKLSGPDAKAAVDMGLVSNRSPQGEIVVSLSSVYLQYAHRLGAVVVCMLGFFVIFNALQKAGARSIVTAPALVVFTLFVAQFALGVFTVFSGTDPLIATMHQATGAVLIATATWLAVRIHLAEYATAPALADDTPTSPALAAATPTATPATA